MKNYKLFSVLFFLKPTQRRDLKHSLFIRILYNSKRAELSLKQLLFPHQWDTTSQRVKTNAPNAYRINRLIDMTRTEINEVFDSLIRESAIITAKAIKSRFLKEDDPSRNLMHLVDYHYEIAQTTIRPGTLKNYRTTKVRILGFLEAEYKSDDISLDRLTYSFITRFENYLRTYVPSDHQKKMGNNTVMKHIQRFRKIVKLAVQLEWLDKDPFQAFETRYIRNDRVYLSRVELDEIINKDIDSNRLSYIRDLFVFSCYTGLAYIDVMSLTPDHINIGIDGNKWIITKRQKTDIPTLSRKVCKLKKLGLDFH